jgi:hypothetical protein
VNGGWVRFRNTGTLSQLKGKEALLEAAEQSMRMSALNQPAASLPSPRNISSPIEMMPAIFLPPRVTITASLPIETEIQGGDDPR